MEMQRASRENRTMGVVEALYENTAIAEDVYAALGWEIRPHRRLGRARYDNGAMYSLSSVTTSIDDAMHLIDTETCQEAMRAAMALKRPFKHNGYKGELIARRLCVIALTRPEYLSEFAPPRV